MEIKDKAYLALKYLGGRATESQLVDQYIKMNPDYDIDYNETESTSIQKLRGSINSRLVLNNAHDNISLDKSVSPYEYYITDMSQQNQQNIIIQPIGKNHTIDDFLTNNSDRWAEKKRYKKQWLQSKDGIVLFIKDSKIFAHGSITKIEESNDKNYPLNYYYYLQVVDNIDYNKIVEFAEPKLGNFRNYELLDNIKSNKIIKYMNSIKEIYLNDDEADIEFQKNIIDINPAFPDEKPQTVKKAKERNGNKIFPRNLSYAKASLEKAKYLCKFNENHTTFISKSTNKQYMEAHHLIPIKVQDEFLYSLDVPANIISLCPNCHRKVHFGNSDEILELSLKKRKNELAKFGLEVSFEELKIIYTL